MTARHRCWADSTSLKTMARAAVPRVRSRTVKRVDSIGFVVRKGIQCSAGKSNTPQREGAPPSGRSDPQASTSLRWTKRRVPGADKSLTAAPAEAGAMEQAAGARLRPLRVTGQASRRSICPRDIRPVGLERSAQMTAVRRLIPGTAVIIALIQRQRRQLKGMPTRADVVRALPALQVGDLLEALSADCHPLTARRSPVIASTAAPPSSGRSQVGASRSWPWRAGGSATRSYVVLFRPLSAGEDSQREGLTRPRLHSVRSPRPSLRPPTCVLRSRP